MARPILLSNDELHVGLNKYGLVHDFYYPYVGQENHTAAKQLRHRIGVWVDDSFSWLDDGNWRFKLQYHHDVLVSHILATHTGIGIALEFDDFVDSSSNAFMRNIHIINHGPQRQVRLFMHQVFILGDSYGSDTAQYIPDESAIMHYKGHRVMIASASHADSTPFDQWSVGLFGIEGREGTYRDAEDGELSGNSNEHGRVDSVIRLSFDIQEHSSARAQYWIAAGKSMRETLTIHRRIQSEGVLHRLLQTTHYWRHWSERATTFTLHLPAQYRRVFTSSALLLKAQQDKHGAIIASTDTTMLNYSRDSYAYFWPRDGSYVIWPLIRLGYQDEPLKFFSFCRRVLHEGGYLLHKYQPDGAVGSSWHSYLHNGHSIAPIQEDETAMVLFLFGQYYQLHPDKQLLREYYPTLIAPMANFLAGFIDETTGLPLASYDLWEEKYLTTTYTTAVVYAALIEAAVMADVLGESEAAVRWRNIAEDIKRSAKKLLFNVSRGFFYKGLDASGDETVYDETVDTSSFFGAFMYGLFDVESPQMKRAYKVMLETISTPESPMLPRYEHDAYLRENDMAPSNAWFITMLWHAQYLLETGEPAIAHEIIDWVIAHALETGVLSEQIRPDGSQTSVAPLAWSHAELLSTLLDLDAHSLKDIRL